VREAKQKLIIRLGTNHRLAHEVLFKHRHPDETPDFHYEIVDLVHSDASRLLFLAFRGGGKSTIAEEATVVDACLERFRNKVILGSSLERAVDRLKAIRHEFETNDFINEVFGDLVGPTWNDDKIVLANGVCIQAFGQGQRFRGVKHLDHRPDRLDVDDLEDEESVATPEAREKLKKWFLKVVLPACDPDVRVRMYATPLNPEALPMHLMRTTQWLTRTYPVYFLKVNGKGDAIRVPTWPGRYPLDWIDQTEREFAELGATQEFAQEYLCMPEDPRTKTFTEGMLKVVPRVHTWHPTFAAYDPARTVGARSASTGKVVFSWIGPKLVIWEATGRMWMPDELIDDIFRVQDDYHPVAIGIEEQGLHEFINQPLRSQSVLRAEPLPLRTLKPPKGKIDFIRSLQPFFKSGEVEFADAIDPEARAQILGFPTGKLDVPNALAYALIMRPGKPVYEAFGTQHVVEEIRVLRGEQAWLVINATAQYTCAALLQVVRGRLNIAADWVREGGPGEVLEDIVKSASLEAARGVKLVCPRSHFSDYDLIGLRASAQRLPADIRPGGDETQGREELRSLLTRLHRDVPMVQVSSHAHWSLNAFAAGYAQRVEKHGGLSAFAVEGPYRVLMEGLEAFVALMNLFVADSRQPVHYATAPDGRRYVTTMTTGEQVRPLKEAWLEADSNEAGRTLTMRR
jgi:hypothetical protein